MSNFVLTMMALVFTHLISERVVYGSYQEEAQLLIAIYEYQFNHNASSQQQSAGVYCLSQSLMGEFDNDPLDIVIEKFSNYQPPVRKVLDCNHSMSGVTDKNTEKKGIIFFVTKLMISGDSARATGGYYEGGLSASLNTYLLKKRNGTWRVIEAQLNMIS